MADPRRSLRHVQAAQLRARVTRSAIIKVIFGMVFLAGALGHARAFDRHDRQSLLWMTLLLVMSTANVALGIRGLARARRRSPRWWWVAALAWGLLATILVGFLLRG
jgi:heme/copper-type cytochrome/quinol oxidase subunit 3